MGYTIQQPTADFLSRSRSLGKAKFGKDIADTYTVGREKGKTGTAIMYSADEEEESLEERCGLEACMNWGAGLGC